MVDDRALASALEALPIAVIIVDRDGAAVWANAAARTIVDRNRSDTNDIAFERLVDAVANSDAVREAWQDGSGKAIAASARLPTDAGLIEREVTAVAVGDAVIASFPTAADVRASDEEQAAVVARVEALLEHTADIITVLDADGTIRFSNASAGRITGFSGGAVNGRNAIELVHPDDADRVAIDLLAALERPGVGPMTELRLRFADGTWHHVEARINNLIGVAPIDGLVVTIHDVTERIRSEARARSLVENLTDVVVILDAHFEVTYASPAIDRIIHAPADSNIGMSAFNDVHPDDADAVRAVLTDLVASEQGSVIRIDFRLETRPGTGDWRWIEATAVNRLDDPAVCGIVCTLRDVTEQRELDRLKDDFLATVSHELRTPLATITGFADLLRHDEVDEDLRGDLLDRIAASADEMRSMVDNLLDFSALDAGKVGANLAPVDLRDAVASAISTLGQQLDRHHVHNDVPAGLVAYADPYGLGHVMRNLLGNAAKYSEKGTDITVTGSRNGSTLRVEIADRGIGIAPEHQALVFERFYRAPGAMFAGRGTGIGLNIVRRYVELMDGRVGVRSRPGAGSTFWVELPVPERDAQAGTG